MKLKDIPTKYDFKNVEAGKYEYWLKAGFFTAGDNSKKPYTIVIPPPNITGKLHLGHVWDTTLQDIIIRRKRMMGMDALFLPGMDHASIATQAKIEAKLREQGISRYDLGRDKFLEYSWQWKEQYADLIRKQWAVIGLSLDYTRERFTLDKGLNQAVNAVFIQMYNEGLIYRGERIINWDIQSKTALSNIEVEYKEVEGAFYYFLYPFVEGEGGMVIATTRPETMFGDTALMVHPEDERYQSSIGKLVYIPGTNRKIKVIADEYVDRQFKTGIVKVTPAHDPNDFEVGNRHQLQRILCMNEDGTMNKMAEQYEGMDRFVCRKALVRDLIEKNLCLKVEKMRHAVGHSERTGVIVEPRLSKQWFVKMEPLANAILEQQQTINKIRFTPKRFEKIFLNWLNNIQDWCISRQLWWGHRIPAWYRGNEVFVGVDKPKGEDWVQDEDALDTWFSSALWPFSTLGWPNQTEDYKRYFPTDTLVTGYDIIFFWVARMAFQSKYLTNQKPFQDVLIHGIIRDELGRKVSKSLDNGVDMMDAVNQYGIDSLRYFLTTSTSPGQDIRYSDEKMEATWNYFNKLWNIARYIGIQFETYQYQLEEINPKLINSIDKWILSKLNKLITVADRHYEKYEFGEVAKNIYHFVWDDFASWYLEMTKVVFAQANQSNNINTCAVLNYVLTAIIKLLHPFAPFITEEIYQNIYQKSIVISDWPIRDKQFDFKDTQDIRLLFDIITTIRNIRATKNVPYSQKIDLTLQMNKPKKIKFIEKHLEYLQKFVQFQQIKISQEEMDSSKAVVVVLQDVTVIVPLASLIDLEEEKLRLEQELKKMKQEISRCKGLLENTSFLAKAPTKKIEEEKEKLLHYQERLAELTKLIAEL